MLISLIIPITPSGFLKERIDYHGTYLYFHSLHPCYLYQILFSMTTNIHQEMVTLLQSRVSIQCAKIFSSILPFNNAFTEHVRGYFTNNQLWAIETYAVGFTVLIPTTERTDRMAYVNRSKERKTGFLVVSNHTTNQNRQRLWRSCRGLRNF